jgi:hypothetical protein
VIRDAYKVDPEISASEFDAGCNGELMGEDWVEEAACVFT